MASALALYLNAALAKERQASENRRFCFLEFLFFFPFTPIRRSSHNLEIVSMMQARFV